MNMKKIRVSSFCLTVLLLAAPMVRAQDLSKYRAFSLGSSVATVLKHTDQKPADVTVIHQKPALMQELTWWPPSIPGRANQPDSIEQMLFSFHNGELYKMSVIYERFSTEGLTGEDMVKSISAKYGPARYVALAIDLPTREQSEFEPKPVATWDDSEYSFNLVRSSLPDGFQLVIYSKPGKAAAEADVAKAIVLEKQEAPQRETARQKVEADALEVARQKNQKSFRP
jgi:hypothetical protein